MLYPAGGRDWDWSVSGTDHERGIQPADVQVLLDHGATVVVLSRGMQRRLQVAAATMELLDSRGVQVRVAQTEEAVEVYNGLAAAGTAVGGLFHSTC